MGLNYARYLPAYLSEITHLQETLPRPMNFWSLVDSRSRLVTNLNPFGRVPFDQVCEETVNKDTQTEGGNKGFSLKAGVVSKYYIASEFGSIFWGSWEACMLNLSKSNSEDTDL